MTSVLAFLMQVGVIVVLALAAWLMVKVFRDRGRDLASAAGLAWNGQSWVRQEPVPLDDDVVSQVETSPRPSVPASRDVVEDWSSPLRVGR